jgi:hypothetical protein
MGNAISKARKAAREGEKKEVQEQLDFLVNAANGKLDKYQNQIEE